MFSLVLAAAVTAPAAHYPDNLGVPYLCCGCGHTATGGGRVIFYWSLGDVGPTVSAGEMSVWKEYLALLDEPEKSDLADTFNRSDIGGQRRLIAAASELKTKTLTVTIEDVLEAERKEKQKEPERPRDLSRRDDAKAVLAALGW